MHYIVLTQYYKIYSSLKLIRPHLPSTLLSSSQPLKYHTALQEIHSYRASAVELFVVLRATKEGFADFPPLVIVHLRIEVILLPDGLHHEIMNGSYEIVECDSSRILGIHFNVPRESAVRDAHVTNGRFADESIQILPGSGSTQFTEPDGRRRTSEIPYNVRVVAAAVP
jgi:hypothetical protein